MLVQDKRIARIANSAPIGDALGNKSDFTSLNVESLKGILSYISHLHTSGDISDKAREALVRYACSIFIENEVEERVQEAIESKLLLFWQFKFSTAIDKYIFNSEEVFYGLNKSKVLRKR